MEFSLLLFLIVLLVLFLIFIFGRAQISGQGQRRDWSYQDRTSQDDNISLLPPPIVPHTDPVDFGSGGWDSSRSVDTSNTDFGGFDSGGGDLGSSFASEIGGGSDSGGSDFGGGGDGGSF